MRRYVGWSGAVALALLSVVGLSSCGGGTNSTNSPPSEPGPKFVLDPPGTSSNAGSMSIGVSAAGLDGNLADRITVFAQVLDPRRQPLVGVPVGFQADFADARFIPDDPAPDAQPGFPSGVSFTDGDGIAQITLVAPSEAGRMAVTAFTSRNLRLGGLIFVNVFDVGFIPQENNQLAIIPSEIAISDPVAGAQLQFVVVGGVPFNDSSPPPGVAASDELEAPVQVTPPYLLQNAASGVGVAELIFEGRFPATVRYTVGGRVGGIHGFGVVDARGQSVTGTVTVEFSELVITPESATLEVGQTQTFSLSGGVPPYNCVPSGGVISPTEITERGGFFTFSPNEIQREGTFTIICSDQSGQTVSADVSIQPLPTPEPSGGPSGSPTPAPPEPARVTVDSMPPTLNGPDGGTSTITATVLDQQFRPMSGVPVIFTLQGQTGDPTPTVPSISVNTGITNGNGETFTVLTVPPGTSPQFITVTAETDNGKSATAQVGVTSQTTGPSEPAAGISSALLRADGCQLNQDGTLTAILSALVFDANGNPTSAVVNWSDVVPADAVVVSPTFTNEAPPCNVSQYRAGCTEEGQLLMISAQPGTAVTCLTFDQNDAGRQARVTAGVAGTDISVTTSFILPAPAAAPTPSPAPPPPATPTPAPPVVAPANASLDIGQVQVFAISGGVPPYMVSASGGSATPTTVPSSGGTFEYSPISVGSFTILISDSNGQVTSAQVTNSAATVITVDKPGPLSVGLSVTETITIVGGGVPPYTVSLSGGLGGSISGSPLPAPGTFDYNAPAAPTSGQIIVMDSDTPANAISISVSVP